MGLLCAEVFTNIMHVAFVQDDSADLLIALYQKMKLGSRASQQ